MKTSKRLYTILSVLGLGLTAVAAFSAPLAAQDTDTTRGIVAEEFVKARPAKQGSASAKVPTYKLVGTSSKTVTMASLRANSAAARELGITIWRLRPSVSSDGG